MKNQEIEEKARELADMVGSVAVDENLPLEVIEMTADILKEDCEQIRQAAVDIRRYGKNNNSRIYQRYN